MNFIRRIHHLVGVLAGLACAVLGLAVAAPAAFAVSLRDPGGTAVSTTPPRPPGSYPCSPACPAILTKHPVRPPGHVARPVYQVHTVVVGGMPGWQIALIALGAALVAAAATVAAYRAHIAHRTQASAAA